MRVGAGREVSGDDLGAHQRRIIVHAGAVWQPVSLVPPGEVSCRCHPYVALPGAQPSRTNYTTGWDVIVL